MRPNKLIQTQIVKVGIGTAYGEIYSNANVKSAQAKIQVNGCENSHLHKRIKKVIFILKEFKHVQTFTE